MIAQKMVKTTEAIELDIKGITLLSIEEYETYREHIKRANGSWWLRSPGCNDCEVTVIDAAGVSHSDGVYVNYIRGLRPVLKINLKSSNLQIGDKIELMDYRWTIISDKLILCDEIIAELPFREDWKVEDTANDYNKSDIKQWLEDWYTKQTEPACEDAISRQDLSDKVERYYAERGDFGSLECSWILDAIRNAPPVEPKIYGNEHNCIMTLFGECSYSETGCGDCAVVEKVRDALKGECPPVEPELVSGDTISREALIQSFLADCECEDRDEAKAVTCSLDTMLELIDDAPPVTPTKKRTTETMIVDGEEIEIDPVSYEIGYTHGQTAPTVNEDHISKESVGDEGITFR